MSEMISRLVKGTALWTVLRLIIVSILVAPIFIDSALADFGLTVVHFIYWMLALLMIFIIFLRLRNLGFDDGTASVRKILYEDDLRHIKERNRFNQTGTSITFMVSVVAFIHHDFYILASVMCILKFVNYLMHQATEARIEAYEAGDTGTPDMTGFDIDKFKKAFDERDHGSDDKS